jgi:hypothetical protein
MYISNNKKYATQTDIQHNTCAMEQHVYLFLTHRIQHVMQYNTYTHYMCI